MTGDMIAGVQNWGRQTIVFALQFRDDPDWDGLSDEEQAKAVQAEYEPICESLWNAAQSECGAELIRMPKVFSKHVLRWVQQNAKLD